MYINRPWGSQAKSLANGKLGQFATGNQGVCGREFFLLERQEIGYEPTTCRERSKAADSSNASLRRQICSQMEESFAHWLTLGN